MTLRIDGLAAGYGPGTILREVSVAPVAPGTLVGLIGPNASGKSTLMRCLAGLKRARAGAVRLDGRDVAAMPRRDRARAVAYMPQAFGCNALLTVFESVLLALKQGSGWRVGDANLDRVADTLSALGLAHLADRGVADLSGGQAQMVAVARSLVRTPRVVLLDEPTSALDLHHQLSILSAVRRDTAAKGAIAIAALHDLNLAAQFCDRLILLSGGRVLADGTPDRVLALPEIGATYRVATALETTRRGTLYVDATLEGAA